MTDCFGLRIPQGALKTILKRAHRQGYVSQIERIYRRNANALAPLDLAKVRQDVLRRHEGLIRKLIEFCKTRHQITWSEEEAEAALLFYLQELSRPILAAAVEGEPIPAPKRFVRHVDFLVNAFIMDLYKGDPEGFEFLETIVKGTMLANVLLFPDLGGITQRLRRVEVYFDTPFLLRALGLVSKSMQAPCRELMDLLYDLDAELICFDHTIDEIRGILDVAARASQDRKRLRYVSGETIEYLINTGSSASDIELINVRLEKSLRRLRVRVKPKPSQTAPLGLNETRLEAILQEEVGYRRKDTLYHDLDSLTAIHRLRRGAIQRKIESCNSIFVTTNASLARASIRFFTEEYGDVHGSVPHCILDHQLTTVAWLKKPLAAPDLPRKRIIADCYAAMNPSDNLWKLYLDEIGRLQQQGDISEEDYHLLRFSMEARNALMETTLGDPDTFTEGTVEEVLAKARTVARADLEAALQAERGKSLEAERRIEAQLDRFRTFGVRGGYWMARVVQGAGIALLALAVYLTLPGPFPSVPEKLKELIAPALLFALALLTIANLAFGKTLRSLVRHLETSISRFIEQTLIRIFPP